MAEIRLKPNLADLAPGSAGVMIRTNMRGIAEIDRRVLPPRQDFDLRIFLFEPLFHKRLVPLQRAMQWLLATDAKLRQQAPHRLKAEPDPVFVGDQLRDHLARPQRKLKLQLQRILLRNCVIQPLQLPAVQLRRPSRHRLRLQRSPPAAPIGRQPLVDRRPVDPERFRHNLGALPSLYAPHRAPASLQAWRDLTGEHRLSSWIRRIMLRNTCQ